MKKCLLRLSLILLLCSQAMAESSVWKAQKGESVIYIGGTFHILRQSDFPLPTEFEKAYAASDALVFETDIGKLNAESTQQKLMANAVYADGSTVDKHLSAETYTLLSRYCAANSIPLFQLKQFKPSIIAATMIFIELSKFGAANDGVDMFFYKAAKKGRKAIEGLETVDEQINFIVAMGQGNEDDFMTYTIKDLNAIKQDYEAMVDAWKKGNEEKLYQLTVSEIKIKMPGLYKSLIADRNEKWLPKIETLFENQKCEFVLVGMGHLVGPEGILETLRQKGCKVEKL